MSEYLCTVTITVVPILGSCDMFMGILNTPVSDWGLVSTTTITQQHATLNI